MAYAIETDTGDLIHSGEQVVTDDRSVEDLLSSGEVEETDDPFHPDNVGTLNFIMLSRIYDLLMLDLDARYPEKAKQVLDLHLKGYILGPPPELNGEFLSNSTEPTA